MSPGFASPHIEKSTEITNGDICSSWLAASLCQNVCSTAGTPLTEIMYNTEQPPYLFGAVSRAIWDAVSQAIILILPQIKLNSQLSRCAFFSVNTCLINLTEVWVSLA